MPRQDARPGHFRPGLSVRLRSGRHAVPALPKDIEPRDHPIISGRLKHRRRVPAHRARGELHTRWPTIDASFTLSLLAAGCGSGAGDDTGGSGEAPDSLTVWRMGDASEDENEFMDSVTEQYQELYPDTEVDIQCIPWGEC